MRTAGTLLFLVGCWAPEIAELPPEAPEPPPPRRSASPQISSTPADPAPEPPVPTPDQVAPPSPVTIPATPREDLPAAPFTAWTTEAPITLVGPGGRRVAMIDRLGVRVEVLQVLDARIRVTCTGCPGEDRDVEGWLQHGTLRAVRTPGTREDPLSAALMQRAAWAGEVGLPGDTHNDAMCHLVDAGLVIEGDEARLSTGGGTALFRREGDSWHLVEATAPTRALAGACRTSG